MRTDRTFVCTACRIRSWPVRRCPACGETKHLADLEVRSLEELERSRSKRDGDLGPVLMATGGLGVIGSMLFLSSGQIAAAEIGVLASIGTFVAGILRRMPKDGGPEGPYRLLDTPIVRERVDRIALVGRVRAARTLVAPLSGAACVAWRLVAEGDPMPLDDARAVPFTLVLGAQREIEVEAGIATLDLPTDSPPAPLRTVDDELGAWLRARGVAAKADLLLRESLVRDGDEVEIAGTVRIETKADGYRGHAEREVLADLPGSPLVVRARRASRTIA